MSATKSPGGICAGAIPVRPIASAMTRPSAPRIIDVGTTRACCEPTRAGAACTAPRPMHPTNPTTPPAETLTAAGIASCDECDREIRAARDRERIG